MDIGKARQAYGAQVAVRGVDHELHCCRQGLLAETLGRAALGGARAGFGGQPLLGELIDQRQHHPQVVAPRSDAVLAHQRGIQAGHVRLDDAPRDAASEQMQGSAAVRGAVARLMRGQRHTGTQVSAHQQRVDHTGCRASVG